MHKLLLGLAAALTITVTPVLAAKKTITFIHLNDIHAHLVPHKDLVSDGNGGTTIATRGGLTRIATVVKEIRADNANSVLMNIGDATHGGVEALFSAGNSIVGPLNALGIDVGVAGNWDFYYTPAVTRARYGRFDTTLGGMTFVNIPGMDSMAPVKQLNYPNLGANVRDITDFMSFLPGVDEFMPATYMMTVNRVKVGFVGLTSDIVEDMHPMLAEGMDFSQGEAEHRALVTEHAQALRDQGAQIVVVMSELGIHKDKRLADTIPAGLVDVFFSAHTHELTRTPVESDSGALVVEAGNDGYVGRMDMTLDIRRGVVRSITPDWTLIPVDDSVAEDADMRALVDAERAQYLGDNVFVEAPPFVMQTLTESMDTVIGHAHGLADRRDALESSFNNGWTDLLRAQTGTQIAMTPGFRMGASIAPVGAIYEDGAVADGEITIEDAYRFFPMAYSIATAQVSGARLRQIMETNLTTTFSPDVFNQRGGWTYGYAGLDIEVDLAAADGQRIKSLTYGDSGVAVQPGDTISVTGCRRTPVEFDGYLCGYNGFENIEPVLEGAFVGLVGDDLVPIQAVDMFRQALAGDVFDGSRRNITDTNNTPRWPETEFVQPLEGVGGATGSSFVVDDCGYFNFGGNNCATDQDTRSFGGFSFMGF